VDNLRALLVQRAARLQDRPALTAPDWGTLSWSAWRKRVEGLGFGLMAQTPLPAAIHASTGTAWDWACEVAAACCGLAWEPAAAEVETSILGGQGFHPERGRGPYHDREKVLSAATSLGSGLDHGAMLLRLQRLNRKLEWDHTAELRLPLESLALPEARAALWSLLYAGGHGSLEEGAPRDWNPGPFSGFWEP
jgi:hypothetical protein